MEIGKIKIEIFVCWIIGILIYSCKPTISIVPMDTLSCEFDTTLWHSDTCGTNGFKKKIGNCLRLKSIEKPIFKNENDVLHYLGKPDTVFNNFDMSKTYFYVIDGSPTCMFFFPDGVLESLSIFIDKEKKVISISGGIH
jgi:hypothetical protein